MKEYTVVTAVPSTLADGDVPVTIRIGGFETQSGATVRIKR